MSLRDIAQELVELGPRGTIFRVGWELKGRFSALPRPARRLAAPSLPSRSSEWTDRLQLEDPIALGRSLAPRIPAESLARLQRQADEAINGRIVCFGRWSAEF